jgi:hypothetical protein
MCSAVFAEQGLCEIGANKEFKEIDFSLADLITSYIENGREYQLEAFRLAKNSENITRENLGKQKWFSVGQPRLIETIVNKKESIFHSTSNGIYANIELLTEDQKRLLAQTATNKYRINITSDNIKNLKLSCFKCIIKLVFENGTHASDVKGEVKSFERFPLLIKFEMNQEETNIFQDMLNKDILDLECQWRSFDYLTETVLYIEKSLIRRFNDKVFDCNYGGLWACINSGKCGLDGVCKCKEGYSGDNCAECKNKNLVVVLVLSVIKYFFSFNCRYRMSSSEFLIMS